ncbi:SubName: Full=Uncharacterized protein {ECO:0000313/EMBL:CCA73763.1} [Serendipita indica DSM 11827]|uniref:Kinetochore protein Spc24 n=1 Tax=Serendipita indica (strain DSM 11827) TaxID=1109443 RepID=G4TR20_SERID|nr:SubName: Full=Uncharacterized protein {ECO:0000313/EMBL:CCA73763.1} [Serendipita indica DSM 11827]CCA73763.1 hypothetical protein PIIN_07718 [Serendipita indica DSM 11827]
MEPPTRKGPDLEDVSSMLVAFSDLFRRAPDMEVINEGTDHTKKVSAARNAQLESIRTDLRALSKSLEASKTAAQRSDDVPSRAEHTRTVETLEQKHFASMKAIGKLERELGDKVSHISRVKDETAIWELKDPIADHEVDNLPLRAQIWKSLGFELRRGPDGKANKLLIRTESGDWRVHPVHEKLSVDETNELWSINAS